MSADNNDVIIIYPKAKHHQVFVLLSGCSLLLLTLLLMSYFWQTYRLPLMVLLFASLVLLLVSYMKFTEPAKSFALTREEINYQHRYGHWHVTWQDIVRLDQVRAYIQQELTDLPYIGIRLTDISKVADNISPRLASRLLHEQKELLILAAKNGDIVLENGLIEFSPYKLNNRTYKGPTAAWLYRTEQLVTLYGFHLYLPTASLDRDINDFIHLLKECKHYAQTA